jgi:hypothetical protein
MPVIPALSKRKQVDCEFKESLGYIMSSRPGWTMFFVSKKKTNEQKKNKTK